MARRRRACRGSRRLHGRLPQGASAPFADRETESAHRQGVGERRRLAPLLNVTVHGVQPAPPVHEHSGRTPRRPAARGGLPADVGRQRRRGLPVRQALELFEHQRRGDHLSRDRRALTARREQIRKQLVGEDPAAVLGQEGLHRPGRHQMPAHRRGVQQLTINSGTRTLHAQRSRRRLTSIPQTVSTHCTPMCTRCARHRSAAGHDLRRHRRRREPHAGRHGLVRRRVRQQPMT